MMENNILFIVEGGKTEPEFFNCLGQAFSLKYEIYCVGTNIYSLYKKMKEIDFNGDVKDVLKEMHPEKREILSKRFAFTYLIFDCDAHHSLKHDDRNIYDIVISNLDKIKEMSEYFVDETDPTIGRLYINYPMMESYRDCNDFFDDHYEDNMISIKEIVGYKRIVADRKLCRIHLDKYTRENFKLLILQNVFKLNKIINGKWIKPSFKDFTIISTMATILKKEKIYIENEKVMPVLNTSLFVLIDFFGNKNGFYDSLSI